VSPEAQKAARDELAADLEALRRHNVKYFTQNEKGGFTVEFFPPTPPEMKEPQRKATEDDTCHCGHHLGRDHMNGFCIHGCLNCNPEEQKEQKPKT
jgi:hypothetical protein